MCAPLAAIAGVVSAVGSGVSALQASAAKRYQAKIEDRNAALANEAGRNALDNGREEAARLQRKIGQLQGQQVASMAANGIDTGFGSALDVQRDTAAMGVEDVRSLYGDTHQEVRGFDMNAANHRAQAQAARQAASGALVKGVFDMGSGLLDSVDKFKKR